MSGTESGSEHDPSESTPFLDFALVVARSLWLLVLVPVLAVLGVIALTWTTVPTYSATARAYLAVTPALADQYVALGKSRPLSQALAKRFSGHDAGSLLSHVRVSHNLGILSVEVEDPDPAVAAELANGFVEELATLTQSLAITDVSRRRLFFQNQLDQVKRKLAQAQAALKDQGASQATLKKLAESPLDIAARLAGQIAFQEMRLNLRDLRGSYEARSLADLRSSIQDIAGLSVTMARLEEANALKASGDESRLGPFYRDFKLNQILHELVAQQYEMERFEETRLIQFIERALPPPPSARAFFGRKAAETATVAFTLALLAVLLRHHLKRMHTVPAQARKLDELYMTLRKKGRIQSRR